MKTDTDEVLLGEINKAVATMAAAQTELVSRSKAVGELLLEAKKLHPAKKDFDAFLRRVNGLHISRAYDLLRLAGGRVTDEELRQEARERQRKSRAKRKLPKPEPQSESVTVTDPPTRIAQSPEISAQERRAQNAALDTEPEPTPVPEFDRSTGVKESQRSQIPLNEFKFACKNWLPKITEEADRQEALRFVTEMLADKKAKAA
jgi:hypothetical protein